MGRLEPSDSYAMTAEQKTNRRMLIWFLITLLIALLPWFLLAD
jgi:hypothetical protein